MALVKLLRMVVMLTYGGYSTLSSNVEYKKLVDHLFGSYIKEIRPTFDHNLASSARLSIFLTAIDDLDEKDQIFVSSVVLRVRYLDQYMSWTPSAFGGIEDLIYPQNRVWLPDLVVENSVEKLSPLGFETMNVKISNRGIVTWRPSEVLRTSCDIDVTYYPFDTQTCSIIISTWVSVTSDVRLQIDEDTAIDLTKYQENGAWELVEATVDDISSLSPANRIAFNFKIKRRKTYYILNIIVPVIALCATASLVFALPADAGEKIGMSITVLLAYAVYLTIISENMPKTSLQVSILSVYLSLLLMATAMAVVCSVFVLHIHHGNDEIEPSLRWRKLAIKLRPLIGLHDLRQSTECRDGPRTPVVPIRHARDSRSYMLARLRNNKIKDDYKLENLSAPDRNRDEPRKKKPVDNFAQETKDINVKWKHVSETVDRLFFIIFTLFIVVITIVFVCLLTIGSP